jgi:hypothetical protein
MLTSAIATPLDTAVLVGKINEASRAQDTKQLHELTRKLAAATTEPEELAFRFALQPLAQASMCAVWRSGMIKDWQPGATQTASELAAKAREGKGMDPNLAVRLMRALSTFGVFNEVGEESYEHNALSRALFASPLAHNIQLM